MNIGDKVRITEGVYRGLIGTITSIEGGKIYVDNDYIDAKKVWYYYDNLESISDQKDVDTLLSSGPTMSDDEERLLKNARATFDDSDKECMKEVNFASGTADNTNQRTASGVDPYTAEIGDPVIKYWYDRGYHDGHDKGYKTGMQAVITNIKRFLGEIQP